MPEPDDNPSTAHSAGAPCAADRQAELAVSSPAARLALLELSDQLRRRRFETLPMTGPGAVFTDVQGRGPGESTRPAALADLISSIASCGVLQPVLVEETITPAGPRLRLVLGERRLRACRWGATEDPDNPHFTGLPAVVCPGPLSEEDVRAWQLIENLAREPLQPGELAEALLLERCAMLTTRLLGAGIAVPREAAGHDDPVQRWTALQTLRPSSGPAANIGAAWEDVIRRLGLHLTARKARLLVEAFRTLPRDISSDMDTHRVSLTARCRYAQLFRGREHAATGLWAAIAARGATNLLPAAVAELLADRDLTPEAAIDAAHANAVDVDQRRAAALTRPVTSSGCDQHDDDHALDDMADQQDRDDASMAASGPRPLRPPEAAADTTDDDTRVSQQDLEPTSVDPAVLDTTLRGLHTLLDQLRAGCELSSYDAGTLALLLRDLASISQLVAARPTRGDGRTRTAMTDSGAVA